MPLDSKETTRRCRTGQGRARCEKETDVKVSVRTRSLASVNDLFGKD